MFSFFKKKKNVQNQQSVEEKPIASHSFSDLVSEEKGQLGATDLLFMSEPSNLCLMGIGSTTLIADGLKQDPIIPFIGDSYFGEGAYHLIIYRLINHVTIYLAGRYTWDSVPSSVHQTHPHYLANANYLQQTMMSTLDAYQSISRNAGVDKEQCRTLCSLIESVLNISSALDDNDFERADVEISNATTQFYRLLNMPQGVLKATTMVSCAAGAAIFVIYERLLQHVDEGDVTETFILRRDHGLKCYQGAKKIMNEDFLAPLFNK
ncbi:hypothetical protein ACPV5V_19695 [Vibrio campbellii]|uniref:hypothetical protein n=1 Tax=Vibrio parahaemolyticus TaxID=670 RepID=UPI0028F43456|nr:hypothetical protein [Vibrio parahaemolyticus]WMP07546.1 hypothetical protein NI383_07135 [Vibrio parahaemolyticus]